MSNSPMYVQSVPVLQQMLTALREILRKADAHAQAQSIDPQALLQARLYPDMFPLVKQVQIAADFARGIGARLAQVDLPVQDGQEQSFADLDALLAQTLRFLEGLDAARFDGAEGRDIVLRPGTPKERKLGGRSYLTHYGMPQFFFHVTTAYALLRHNGLAVGKRDYMGSY